MIIFSMISFFFNYNILSIQRNNCKYVYYFNLVLYSVLEMAESTNSTSDIASINIDELSTFELINSTDQLASLINFFSQF